MILNLSILNFNYMALNKFVLRLLVFLAILVVADQIVGKVLGELYKNAGDKFARENYMREKLKDDVLIFGSSHAVNHYVPQIISDSLKMSVYNCGQRGNGIIYEYGRLQSILKRYTPKLILLDVVKCYDLDVTDNSTYLDFLKVDYGTNDSIDKIFETIDPYSPIKLRCQSYKYNSLLCDLVLNNILRNRGRYSKDGFMPLEGFWKIPNGANLTRAPQVKAFNYDSIKLKYIEKMFSEKPKDTKLIVLISPMYFGEQTNIFYPIKKLCSKYSIPMLDYYADKRFKGKLNWYHDVEHLNVIGAKEYSSIVGNEIKELIKSSKK